MSGISLKEKLSKIKIIGLDVDGTLTDGSIYMGPQGEALKVFNAKDGYAIRVAENKGIKVYFITGRSVCEALVQRLNDWGIDSNVRLKGKVKDKVACAKEILEQEGLKLEEMAFMGDDLPDLPLLKQVSFSGAPKDAFDEVSDNVDFVSRFDGGRGAVREFIDLITKDRK
jgi:3-deoxy-D-manno-octulosonate 8-phosphate phosphatase (KDO 8-P phosphatase)